MPLSMYESDLSNSRLLQVKRVANKSVYHAMYHKYYIYDWFYITSARDVYRSIPRLGHQDTGHHHHLGWRFGLQQPVHLPTALFVAGCSIEGHLDAMSTMSKSS